MNVLEAEAGDNATKEEEDTSQHDKASWKKKDKDHDGNESEEEELHEECCQDPLEEKNIYSEKTKIDYIVIEKRKAEDEASSKKKKKQKEDKMKDIMVLTEGDLYKIRDKIHEATTESWNRVEYCCDSLLTNVIE